MRKKLARFRLAIMADVDVATSEVQSEVDVEELWWRGSLLFPYLKGKQTRCFNIRRSTTRKWQRPQMTTDAYVFLYKDFLLGV